MENVAIIGSGTMGHSIALASAWAGIPASVYGVNKQDLNAAENGLAAKLQVMTSNGLFSEAQALEIRNRISLSTQLEQTITDATFIIEAIPEDLELKQNLYGTLETLTGEDTVIASNTSGFRPTDLSAAMHHPERFIVTHFWNPGHLIPLVEVVQGEKTSEHTLGRTMALLQAMNKKPVHVKKEVQGFIGNRLQYALFREAQALLDAGVASKEDIDDAVTYSIGRRLPVTGPLKTADLGGLDVFSSISNYLFADLHDDLHSGKTLTRLVEEGKLGDKAGEGFYSWDEKTSKRINAEREKTLIHFLKQDLEGDR